MIVWLIRRIGHACLMLLLMTVIVFAGLHAVGNPIDILISQDSTQIQRAQMIAQFGLDKPLWWQYFSFLRAALHLDLGNSFVYNQPALHVILSRFPATLELAVSGLLLATFVGIPLGILAGLYPKAWFSRCIMTGSILGFSLPSFWVGLMLIMLFSVTLGWLPSGGRGHLGMLFGIGWSFLTWDGLRHLILPAVTISLFNLSLMLRLARSGTREVMMLDFIKFARAKGLSSSRIVGVHLLKNILLPLVTVTGLEFGTTIAFAVVTETIFSWPGTGRLIIESINSLDRPVIVAYMMLVVLIFIAINLVVDVLYRFLDPRVKQESNS